MSDKTPSGAVANETVSFALYRCRTLLRLVWAPTVISVLIILTGFSAAFDLQAMAQAEIDGAAILPIFRGPTPLAIALLLFTVLASVLVMSGASASICELAATGRAPDGPYVMRFDGPARRAFYAFILISLISLFLWMGVLIVATGLSGANPVAMSSAAIELMRWSLSAAPGDVPPTDLMEHGGEIASVFGWLFLLGAPLSIYIAVKLSPLLGGSVVENRLIPFKSFTITKGHAWSILGATILLWLFMVILSLVAQIVAPLIGFLGEILSGFGGVGGLLAAIVSIIGFTVYAAYQIFVYVIQTAFSAIVYRRLTTGA